MKPTELSIALSAIESEILEACYNQDELTTSDLQGVISAQVRRAYNLGKNKNK